MTDMIDEQLYEYSSDDENKNPKKGKKKTTKKTTKKVQAKSKKTTKKGNTHASTFKDFQLKEELMRGLGEAGFENPSEV